MGVAGYEPWAAAGRALGPALVTGLWGLVIAPVVCVGAAGMAVRGVRV
jgi:hypothetical protein